MGKGEEEKAESKTANEERRKPKTLASDSLPIYEMETEKGRRRGSPRMDEDDNRTESTAQELERREDQWRTGLGSN
ncbi:hypothetical protein PRIPAC_96094 [Pristionchus pacificus]|uniref:Uncharacterized protein n=1 Tax=Pristionchus pacificus TaxID=54126 RepID=A0A2A6B346_PRIPA|nr:hypothetical protein PRIPAC_96094 [Pristionchus pacificus]|eukprot:PDM60292.1 hypothetical protein PRIPAC_54117 [Pristionchus pacificus]